MSTLFLVRHGQASIHAADYDQLSERGKEQARLLGGRWAERRLSFDAAYVGPRRRHRETAQHVQEGAAAAGMSLPDWLPIDSCDEIDAVPLVQDAMAGVLPGCPDLREQLASGELDEQGQAAMAQYDHVFRQLMQRWAGGADDFGDMETFDAFGQRVEGALQQIGSAHSGGSSVIVFTSGGVIAMSVCHALRLTSAMTLDLMFEIVNASVTELRYADGRFWLTRFNEIGHLPVDIVTKI